MTRAALWIATTLFCTASFAQTTPPAAPPSFEIHGQIKSGSVPIPGVVVSAKNTLTGKAYTTSTDLQGRYTLTPKSGGRYVVRAEMPAFQPMTEEVLLNAAKPSGEINLQLILASRAPTPATNGMNTARVPGATDEVASTANAPLTGMPAMSSSSEATSESLDVSGTNGQVQDFGRNIDDIRDRIEEMRSRGELPNAGGFGGGGGGFGGGGEGNMIVIGGGGGAGKRNLRNLLSHPHGAIFFSTSGSLFNAEPYALNQTPNANTDYSNYRFGATIGGLLKIPHVIDLKNTFFFLNLFGNRGDTPFQAFAHVPTLLERNGNFSQSTFPDGTPVQLFDPVTHAPIGTSVAISPQAQTLLKFIPVPNSSGQQNFSTTGTLGTHSTTGAFRIMHSFDAAPMMIMTPVGGGGGRRGRRGSNIAVGLNFFDSTSDQRSVFPRLGGASHTFGLNGNAIYAFTRGAWTNSVRVNLNVQRVDRNNLLAGVENVAGEAGITGTSQAPGDWGVPDLSFSHFTSVTDTTPSALHDRTLQLNDTVGWTHGKHTVRFGADYRHQWTVMHSNTNPRGTFIFTGARTAAINASGPVPDTGYDFADFLLGLPQETTIQNSPKAYSFQSNSYDLFIMDEWRVLKSLSVNAGLRYEYYGPFTEDSGQIVNLDVAPGITAVAPVLPGQVGPFTGTFPDSLVRPDRNNFAPRIGLAWRPFDKTVVRAGYGINYNGGQYRSIVQQLALQPPFSFTETNLFPAQPITLASGFPPVTTQLENNYGVDPNYRLGYVQLWNLNVQRELPWNLLLNVGYMGTKGTALDIVRAPNRGPSGLRIPGVEPFLFETSQGDSVLHAGTVGLRRRFKSGFSIGGNYTYGKSIDNASSIGGGAVVVAQNDLDLAAERGLSSFDQRQKLTGNFIVDLPFGEGRKWITKPGATREILGDWEWSGSFTFASGFPFTARVLGSFAQVAQGVNGTLRADYLGGPIQSSDPTILQWFNTSAFAVPAAGQFGNAGRNTIIGPGSAVVNMALAKTFPMKDMYAFEMRLEANNVFNRPQFTTIDTVVNSPTFGQVIGVGNMRQVQVTTRFRF